jgi:DNA-binding GntR family transcriptional regulator
MYRIETEDLGRKVYKVLKSMIINGDLRSGQKLVQEELAEQLGVSRTPLLFAISKLEQENLVETLPRRGAYVRRYSQRELIDIFDIRCRLEPLAARDAAMNATAEEVEGLARLLEAFDAATRGGDPLAVKRTDYEFHMELLRCCGNRFLPDMLATFHIIIISNTKSLLKPVERSTRDHHRLLKALRARDPDAAEKAMFVHVNESRANLMASDKYMIDQAGA